MNKKTEYTVTDVAGWRPEVAGRRRRAGETVLLTAAEAEYELLRGVVVAGAGPAKVATVPGEDARVRGRRRRRG